MAGIYDWSPIAGNNTLIGSIDWREGMQPKQINNSARALMADVASFIATPILPATTHTGLVTIAVTGEALRIRSTDESPFFAGYNNAGSTRFGYIQFTSANTYLNSDTGNVALATAGSIRLSISAAGAATFTGNVTTNAAMYVGDVNHSLSIQAGNPVYVYDSGNDYSVYDRASNNLGFVIGGVTRFSISATGVSVAGTLTSSGSISTATGTCLAGSGVFGGDTLHGLYLSAGNPVHIVDTNDYTFFTRATNTWTWNVSGVAQMSLSGSGALGVGSVATSAGITVGNVLTVTAGGIIVSAGGAIIAGGAAITGNTSVVGTLATTGAITQGGSQVWHAGNFAPSSYAALAGAAFTGAVSFANDAAFQLRKSGSNPRLEATANAVIEWDAGTSRWKFYVGGVAVASIDASGNFRVKGDVMAAQATV